MPVTQDRETRTQTCLLRGINDSRDHAGLRIALCQYLAPGIHHHAVAKSLTPIGVASGLGRRDDKGQILHSTRTIEQLPMHFTRGACEGRRHGKQRRPLRRQRAKQLRKAHVVTNAQPQLAEGVSTTTARLPGSVRADS